MNTGNFKAALSSLRRSRGRSLLTMFGIIVGVVAVIVTLSIGSGVKRQISDQLNHLGDDTITVRPGSQSRSSSLVSSGGVFAGLGTGPLNQADWNVIRQSEGVKTTVPFGIGSGFATVEGKKLDGSSVIATTEGLPDMIKQKVEFGVFFSETEMGSKVAVVGRHAADDLFDEDAPIGRTLSIRGQDFIVRGVFEEFSGSPLSLGTDLNKAIFIPFPAAVGLSDSNVPIAQILARTTGTGQVNATSANITNNLKTAHAGQQDFSVLNRRQTLEDSASSVNLVTQLVTGLAALSLLVGAVGVINIMLVSVTERTREIGIRKAIGATNRQIMVQFVTEAATLSAVGGLIGVVLSLITIFLIRIGTNLHPAVSWPIIAITPVVAWLLGIFFGVAPAFKAARKDPIEALRYE